MDPDFPEDPDRWDTNSSSTFSRFPWHPARFGASAIVFRRLSSLRHPKTSFLVRFWFAGDPAHEFFVRRAPSFVRWLCMRTSVTGNVGRDAARWDDASTCPPCMPTPAAHLFDLRLHLDVARSASSFAWHHVCRFSSSGFCSFGRRFAGLYCPYDPATLRPCVPASLRPCVPVLACFRLRSQIPLLAPRYFRDDFGCFFLVQGPIYLAPRSHQILSFSDGLFRQASQTGLIVYLHAMTNLAAHHKKRSCDFDLVAGGTFPSVRPSLLCHLDSPFPLAPFPAPSAASNGSFR